MTRLVFLEDAYSVNTILGLTCASLYAKVCRKMREHDRGVQEIMAFENSCASEHRFPATIIHWLSFVENFDGSKNCDFSSASIAIN